MVSKKLRNVLIVFSLILIVLSAFYFSGAFENLGITPLAITGSSTLSLSQVQLQSSNPYLSGQAWLLTFSAGGLGQTYYGTITPSQVDAFTPDSTRTTQNLGITVTYEDESCQYPIGSTGSFTPIYDLAQYKYTYVPLVASCDVSTASSKSGVPSSQILLAYKPSASITCHVIYKTGQTPVGSMGNGNVHAPYTIALNVNGVTATKSIDPISGSTSGNVGTYAYAVWNGNLVSGISCPATNTYRAGYVDGNWRIIGEQPYNTYINQFNSINSNLDSDSSIDTWFSNMNFYIANAKVSTSFGTIDSSSSLINAVAKVPLSSPLQFPVTTLYVKADTLGIYTPVPDIRITSSSSSCFKTGENGIISVGIKNFGTETGTYRAYATCSNPFSITQSASGSLGAGVSKTVNLAISATATEKITSSCTISVETTGGTKTASTSVCVDPQITCTIPYPQKYCGISGTSEVVYQCSSNGAIRNLIETCSNGQYCESGMCKTQSSGGGGTNIFNKIGDWFSNLFSTIGISLTIIKWIVLIIASLSSFFVSRDFVEAKIIKRPKDKVFALIVALLIAVGIGVALYTLLLTSLFWWITIGYILFLILMRLTPLGTALRLFRR